MKDNGNSKRLIDQNGKVVTADAINLVRSNKVSEPLVNVRYYNLDNEGGRRAFNAIKPH